MKKLLEFPELRQTFDYDCGAKALQSVLAYYGIEAREDKIMNEANTTKEGTSIDDLVKTARKYGLKARSRKMTVRDVKKFIDKGVPVILVLQAWTENKAVNWENDWEDGHYVVAIGYDDEKVIFEDPSSFERVYLTYDELKKRWHDLDADGKKYINHGIAFYGKKAKFSLKNVSHMD